MKKKVRKKPVPPSRKLSKKPPTPAAGEASAGINEISSITAAQIKRAEKNIDKLKSEVDTLRNSRVARIETPTPEVTVNIPPRARITKVSIKYDQLGMPGELIPHYSDLAG